MSTILKALRRLEEQKTAPAEGRPLREEVASPVPPPAARRGWAPAAVALVAGLSAGGGVFWLAHSLVASEKPAVVAAAVASAPTPADEPRGAPDPPAPSPEPAPEPAAGSAGPPHDAFSSNVELVKRPQQTPRLADADPIEPRRHEPPGSHRPVERTAAAARARASAAERLRAQALESEPVRRPAAPEPETPPAPATRAVPGAVPRPPVAASPPAPEPAAAPRAAPAPPSPEEAPRAAPAEPPGEVFAAPAPPAVTPPAAEPAAPPAAAPALEVRRTEWHPLSERRRAWVVVGGGDAEPRRVVEGDVVEGMLVSKIEPSGVVFERDGETLRRDVHAPR